MFDIDKALEEISEPIGHVINLAKPTTKETLAIQVANWIDTYVIAEMIIAHLEEQGEELTFERAKMVWLNTLENLAGGIGLAR